MTEVSYVTREAVQHVLNQADSVRNNRRIDAAIRAGSRDVESWTHRRFYPELATRYPSTRRIRGRLLDLDHEDYELTSVVSLTLDGTAAVAGTDFDLTDMGSSVGQGRGAVALRLLDGSDVAWPTGDNGIALRAEFGSSNTTAPAGTLAAAVASTSATAITLSDSSLVGVGDLITVDAERMIVTEKSWVTTGAALASPLADSSGAVTVTVDDGTLVRDGETILIDAERLFVEAVTGNTLIVKRAQGASTLAAHLAGVTVYAPRSATVRRGVTGTTAATHAGGAAIVRNDPPSLVQETALALALNNLEQARAGYARETGTGENARETGGRGVRQIVDDLVAAYGRVRSGAA